MLSKGLEDAAVTIAAHFLKRHPSETLALSNRPYFLSEFAMDNTAVQQDQISEGNL